MKPLNAFHLKLIAITAMLINHIGHTFEGVFNPPFWQFIYLSVGLLTYPIMSYLVVDGFRYTRNRWKYAGRLGLFSLLSFIPFHFVFGFGPVWWVGNNIMFTLTMGVILLMILEDIQPRALQILLIFCFVLLTIMSDWNVFGIPILASYYLTGQKKTALPWILGIVCLLMMWLSLPQVWTVETLVNFLYPIGILGAIPLLSAYDDQRGYSPVWVKWGFYAFYPLHLTILWVLRLVLFGY